MRPSKIKAKLARDEPVLVTMSNLTDPSVHEMTSLMGFDGIWIDLEHHGPGLETVSHEIRATRVGTSDVIARPAKGEFMRMARLLEAGAHGIMYPRCDNAEEAAQVVRWSKFAPLGERGVDASNPDAPYSSMPLDRYIEEANQQTFLVIQLEQACAIEQADAIAAVEGVDILMLGPADFSVLSGIPGQIGHALVREAKEKIASAARNAGIHWGTTGRSVEDIRDLLEMGARFICYGNDFQIVRQGLEKIQHDCASLGFTFDNRLAEA